MEKELTMTIGELSKRSQVGIETVRFYERKGLLAPLSRNSSGYRIYSKDSVKRVQFIRKAKALGFSLREIKELLELRVDPSGNCDEVLARACAKLEDIDARIKSLSKMKKSLERLVSDCKKKRFAEACPILDALEGE